MNKPQTLYKKTCKQCGNVMVVIGTVDAKNRQTEITTRNEKGDSTCNMWGESSLTCLCGKDYRMINRRAWHGLMIQESE